jgi:hypothetical protein
MSNWTLFSNHGHVLVCLARDSEARLRDVAADVGITERAVQKIVRDLQNGDMVSVTKSGRRNCYRIHKKQPLRHDLEANCTLGELIRIVKKNPGAGGFSTSAEKKAELPSFSEPESKTGSRSATVSKPSFIEPEPVKPEPVKPEPVKFKPVKPKPVDPGRDKIESGKPKSSDSKERQQGTLF